MPGEGGAHHQLRSFLISRFPHQDDVRILPQEGTKAGGKGQPDLLVHLRLTNERQTKLHRILQRENGAFIGRKFAQGGVEGGGLARPGGPRHQDDPVGTVKEIEKLALHLSIKTQTD